MDHKFFQNQIVYQIYPRSFCDSNGDGIGDIPGIISKLDYLKKLGVGILWLSPVYKTANADFGYDVSDYYSINPEYGTMQDMLCLIDEAKRKGIRIVMDLVVNHTSDEHEWFQSSIHPDSPYRDFYYWRKGKKNNTEAPNNWTSNFGGSAWTYVPEANAYYLHVFGKKQPDLDWHNPKVLDEVEKILRFWLDKGVYGFRCDVINQIWKEDLNDGKKSLWVTGQEKYLMKEENHRILRQIYEDVFSKYDCMVVGETYNVDFKNARRFTDKELDLAFQFDTVSSDRFLVPIFKTKFKPKKFKKTFFDWQRELDWNTLFLENHDQPRSLNRFGDTKKYFKESAKELAMILLTLRGTPFLYQGEEIGMTDYPLFRPEEYKDPVNFWLLDLLPKFHFSKKKTLQLIHNCNRDNARTPMQWGKGENADFTSGNETWLPVNPNYPEINVEVEEKDPDSILSFYRQLIQFRKEEPALLYGTFEPIKTKGSIMAFYRSYQGEMLFVLLNLTKKNQRLPHKISSLVGQVLFSNYSHAGFTFKKRLRPYEGLIVKIK
ncbi:MAG: alpha-glucosidase [Mollicutes bacterium]|nr:alpha-glucosidase [Mollicutes bacterium]